MFVVGPQSAPCLERLILNGLVSTLIGPSKMNKTWHQQYWLKLNQLLPFSESEASLEKHENSNRLPMDVAMLEGFNSEAARTLLYPIRTRPWKIYPISRSTVGSMGQRVF